MKPAKMGYYAVFFSSIMVWGHAAPTDYHEIVPEKLLNQWGYRDNSRAASGRSYRVSLCGSKNNSIKTLRLQSIKARKPMNNSALYPRATLVLETYHSETSALSRIQKLGSNRPRSSYDSKNCGIRAYFRQGTQVVIVHTDAMIFFDAATSVLKLLKAYLRTAKTPQ